MQSSGVEIHAFQHDLSLSSLLVNKSSVELVDFAGRCSGPQGSHLGHFDRGSSRYAQCSRREQTRILQTEQLQKVRLKKPGSSEERHVVKSRHRLVKSSENANHAMLQYSYDFPFFLSFFFLPSFPLGASPCISAIISFKKFSLTPPPLIAGE